MPSKAQLRQTFHVPQKGAMVREFIAQEKRRAPWKPHSVAMIMMPEAGDRVLLTKVRKVVQREANENIRVPLQGRLSGRTPDPQQEASRIIRDKAGVRIDADDIHYLGYGYSTDYARGHECNKVIHWVACTYPNEAPPEPTQYAAAFEWVHLDALPAFAAQIMDVRKSWLFQQAAKTAVKQGPFGATSLRRMLETA